VRTAEKKLVEIAFPFHRGFIKALQTIEGNVLRHVVAKLLVGQNVVRRIPHYRIESRAF
jgi:hypothetical protein